MLLPQFGSEKKSDFNWCNVSLGALSIVAATKLKKEEEKGDSDELDALELSGAKPAEDLRLETSDKLCKACGSGNIR